MARSPRPHSGHPRQPNPPPHRPSAVEPGAAGGTDRRWVLGVVAAIALLAGACASATAAMGPESGQLPDDLAFDDGDGMAGGDQAGTTTTTASPGRWSATPVTAPKPIPAGTPEQPFAPLPEVRQATAIISPSGVVLPVIADRRPVTRRDTWLVVTPCSAVRTVSGGYPLGRAHVVLDPGHGGREFGAVGEGGLTEKDLNLQVALAAEAMLTEAGATVVLTRSTDIAVTTGARAALARSVDPALFVSIHHNGGAPANGSRPGTIVFTKSSSPGSTRFGGLFHEALTPGLVEMGEAEQAAFETYASAFVANEEAVAAYDRSVAAREAALVANGQLDGTATTLPPERPDDMRDLVDGSEAPSVREPGAPTTTMPVPDGRVTVPVPETMPPPPPFETERVDEFRWAGSGNAGVRPWLDHEGGQDVLSVLRRSGDVPAAVVEYLYVTNPVEERLLSDPAVIELEARSLADAVIRYLSTDAEGTGFVADQIGDESIGGGGQPSDCVEPDLGYRPTGG